MHPLLRTVCESQEFEATAAPYLVLDRNLHIQGVNSAYLRATGRSRDELIGAFMFDAFPDNPEDINATGVRNLNASLERVMRYGTPDEMGVQRYDIPDRDRPGTFRVKTWSPVNSPLTDPDGNVIGALHHVEDITAAHDTLRRRHETDLWDGTRQPPAVLRRAMPAIAHYEGTVTALKAPHAASGGVSGGVRSDLPPGVSHESSDDVSDASAHHAAGTPSHHTPGGPSHGTASRDALWHRIVHTARQGSPRNCAAAVCSAAVRELPTIDAAAITLHGRGPVPFHLAFSSFFAQRVEEIQWVTDESPSLTAFETGQPVLVADLELLGSSWPLFTDAACSAGVTAVFAYPLRSTSASLGTLTLYRKGHTEPTGPPTHAETFAEIAAVVLLADLDTEIAEELRATTDADDINTAIGVMAAVRGVSVRDAAVLLRATAQARRLPLADVARAALVRYLPGGPGNRS
ncbi:PAS domain-containing protein [Streptomyces sp. NPDC047117]|uniref:PAS domain-containing protein n=1 Tax=Streptomyces sp. NPDC047117 TaxID=3155379 RepID=UPI0033ED79C3